MTGCDIPTGEISGCNDDTIPPQKRCGIGLCQRVSFEIAEHLEALPLICRHGLANKERIEKTITRAGIIYRRKILRYVFGQLQCRVIVEVASKIEKHVEFAAIDELLPLPDVETALGCCNTDLVPAFGDKIGSDEVRHRDAADEQLD